MRVPVATDGVQRKGGQAHGRERFPKVIAKDHGRVDTEKLLEISAHLLENAREIAQVGCVGVHQGSAKVTLQAKRSWRWKVALSLCEKSSFRKWKLRKDAIRGTSKGKLSLEVGCGISLRHFLNARSMAFFTLGR